MKKIILFLSLSYSLLGLAQNVEFNKDALQSEENYSQAMASLEKGDQYFFSGNFKNALTGYLDAQNINPNNALLNFKIGACYFKNEELKNAKPYFEKAKALNPKIDPKIDFALAKAYQACADYKNAISAYQSYLASLSPDQKDQDGPLLRKKILYCSNELENLAQPSITSETIGSTRNPGSFEEAPSKIKVKAHHGQRINIKQNQFIYKIQISSTSSQASDMDIQNIYKGSLKVSHDKTDGLFKYYIGQFKTKEEAELAKTNSGVTDAFIVTFKNGHRQRHSIQE